MARKIERIDAKRLYTEELKEIPEIAVQLNVPEKTVYRWKSEDKEKGIDWDREREEIRNTSFSGYKKTLKLAIDMIDKMAMTGEIKAADADAVQKVVKAVKSLYKDVDSLGNILLAMSEFTDFLAERDQDLLEKLNPYLMEFGNAMSKKYGKRY
jgi:transposase